MQRLNANLYEIMPEMPYSDADLDWTNKKSRSSVEMNNLSSRPAIAGKVPNMTDYDVIYVSFPKMQYGFQAAVSAVEMACARGNINICDASVLAARITGHGIYTPPEAGKIP